MEEHAHEIASGNRFDFGKNWLRFCRILDEERIESAANSLRDMLGLQTMDGLTFLDAGSGSGLFSLAAHRMGARVVSFDYDPDSISCTLTLRDREGVDSSLWRVERGSILDESYVRELGRFDIVYSWGVLHHTGDLWRALDIASETVKPGGLLGVAIYNDQGWLSNFWLNVKRFYNKYPGLRPIVVMAFLPYLYFGRWIVRALRNRGALPRGMDLWRDLIDWLGGYPFEVAQPAEITGFFEMRGFTIRKLEIVGARHGCNQFVFQKDDQH